MNMADNIVRIIEELKDDPRLKVVVSMDHGTALVLIPQDEREEMETKEPRLKGKAVAFVTEAQARTLGVI
jgi:hypothetical protein